MEVNDGAVKAPVKGLDYAYKGETAFYISTRLGAFFKSMSCSYKLPIYIKNAAKLLSYCNHMFAYVIIHLYLNILENVIRLT